MKEAHQSFIDVRYFDGIESILDENTREILTQRIRDIKAQFDQR